jgi:hypothetical protein
LGKELKDNVIKVEFGAKKKSPSTESAPPDQERPTFKDLFIKVRSGDTAGAVQATVYLLNVDPKTAIEASTHFGNALAKDPNILLKTMGLRSQVDEGIESEILDSLDICFGLKGDSAKQVMKTLIERSDAN